MSRSDLIDFLLLAAIWGASFLFMRVAAPEFGPFALIGLRSGLAALCLWPLLLARGRETGWGPVREYLPELTVVGVVNALVPFTLFAYAALSLTAVGAVSNSQSSPCRFGVLDGTDEAETMRSVMIPPLPLALATVNVRPPAVGAEVLLLRQSPAV